MKRTLGLDLGTNSIGWAIVEEEGGARRLFKAGAVIFPEGVARVKGNEQPSTLSRTRSRSTRRLYFRRRMRKQKLLRALIVNGMCPLSKEGLDAWIKKDQYPNEPAFTEWFKSNPYELRTKGLDGNLSLMELGRVFYHFAQRRGFKSNRKDGDGQQVTFNEGIPDRGIKGYSDTQKKLEEYGTIGKAGVALAQNNEAIRRRFVRRTDLEKELKQIWDAQKAHHPRVLTPELEKLIAKPKESVVFFQRSLKSKKGTVGRCTLEPSKPRAPISSIEAELFSILHTINTIKVDGRMLNERERDKVLPRFFLKRKGVPFADIEKELKKIGTTGTFKFSKEVNFTSSRTITWLAALWDLDALEIVRAFVTVEGSAQRKQWEDRWSAVYNAEDFDELSDVKAAGGDTGTQRDLKEYATTKWGFSKDQLESLQAFKCKQGYHSLSRKALRRIIPYLYRGIPYHDAVLMAGAQAVFGEQWKNFSYDERAAIEHGINEQIASQRMARTQTILTNGLVRRYRDEHGEPGGCLKWDATWESTLDKTVQDGLDQGSKEELGITGVQALRSAIEAEFKAHVQRGPVKFIRPKRIDERVKEWLAAHDFMLGDKAMKRLYHHSAIETYPHTKDMLRSPARRGVNNPMVMRAMHQLRKLANRFIELEWVDASTQVNIEMARELDSANRRKAWERYQRELEKRNAAAEATVREAYGDRPHDPTKTEILKVLLYEEAKELWKDPKCIFTGERIGGIKDLLDSGDWEIEHIWPRSKTNDNSQANKVLCLKEYNTTVKRDKLPPYLPNFEQEAMAAGKMRSAITIMLEPIAAKVEGYEAAVNIRKENSKRAAASGNKEEKDKAIQERWYFQFKLDYWRTKYEHLTAKEIKPGFLNRQLVATGQITRLAREYMHSYFNKVASYKPEALTSFRRAWLGERFDKEKDRKLHTHHAKDAVVAATVTREWFDALAHHYEQEDNKEPKGNFVLPWTSFPSDMRALEENAVVVHSYVDALGRISRYRRKMPDGTVRYATGDTVRGSLHRDTYYGRIKLKKDGTDEYEEYTVLRRPVKDMSKTDYAKVVDPVLRKKLQETEPEVIAAKEGLPVMVSGKEQIVKRVRTFEKSVKNPVRIKAHRDQKEGAEHKHWLWVKNEETPLMAIYENEKGRRTHYVFSLLELTRLMREATGRHELLQNIPREHPERAGFHLVEPEGKPYVLRVGQEVVLYQQDPEEIRWDNMKEMNSRTYVIRKLEGDGRINLVNVLDARKDDELDEVSTWDPANPRVWLRMSVHGMKGLVVGLDKEMNCATGIE